MIPTEPQDDVATDMPDDAAADIPPDAQPTPEKETDEQWILRFLEENQHLARPRPERPPAPPPSPWDGPPSTWKVPDHLSLRHPKGGYMAMALLSRTIDDLDEVTKGERAATYEVGMAREYYIHGEMELPIHRFSFDPSKYQVPVADPRLPSVPHPPKNRSRK
ncbi:MAG: hypothetical protein WC729_05615 [Sphingomonas sp.]|jgi:hypothetical protein|uniref:hypothetical protein n=1 Tax=Sphingomonas sp. TaxID=28214 RepID=UPI0035663097